MIGTAAAVICGYYLAGGRDPAETLVALVITACVTGLGNVINDYYDLDIDTVNKPHRPLPSGALSPRVALFGYAVGTLAVIAASFVLLSREWLALVVAWQILLFLYARYAKRTLLLGNLLISAIVSSAFFGGALFTGDLRAVAFPVALSFLLVLGRELVKGGEDIDGDRAGGAHTLAVRVGARRTAVGGSLVLLLCVLVVPVPGLMEVYGRWYLAAAELIFVPGILLAVITILRSPDRAALRRTSRILKVQMFLGVGLMWLAYL